MTKTTTKYGPASIDPGEWMWVGNFYQGGSDEGAEVFQDDMRELELQLTKLLNLNPLEHEGDLFQILEDYVERHANNGCASCGAHYAYGSVFFSPVHSHGPELDIIAIGHDCASNLFGLENLAAKQKREVTRLRKVRKTKEKFEAQVATDPELAATFELSFTGNPVDHPKDGTFLQGTGAGIVYDIFHKGSRWGSISEKQADLVKKIAREHAEWQTRKAEKEAERGPVEDVPEGRVEVIGTIISTKWVDNDFGGAFKMLVESDEGHWRVWGTLPAKIDSTLRHMNDEVRDHNWNRTEDFLPGFDFKGSKVRFTAAIEPSKDDKTFGFYSRPTKPELIEAATIQEEE